MRMPSMSPAAKGIERQADSSGADCWSSESFVVVAGVCEAQPTARHNRRRLNDHLVAFRIFLLLVLSGNAARGSSAGRVHIHNIGALEPRLNARRGQTEER